VDWPSECGQFGMAVTWCSDSICVQVIKLLTIEECVTGWRCRVHEVHTLWTRTCTVQMYRRAR